MRKAVIAAAVTTGVMAAAGRRPRRAARTRAAAAVPPVPAVPAQRTRTELEQLVEGDADLVVADQDAQDTHILDALDQLIGLTWTTPGPSKA